jgi:2-alkyl-3-oxoalkanoate reductase
MKILITGASGFLGRYVVAEALRQGHSVRAVMRSASAKNFSWHRHPNVEIAKFDLCRVEGLVEALHGVDAVIHLAAAMVGNFNTQYANTVTATQNLLDAMVEAEVFRLIAISSFSVYDYLDLNVSSTLDESTPIESRSAQRDVYTQTKLLQESSIRSFETCHPKAQVIVLRPGMVYGRDHLWHTLLGIKVSKQFWLRVGRKTRSPLTYVENCAEAVVLAAQCDRAIGQIINIVDDDLPTQDDYVHQVLKYSPSSPRSLSMSWIVLNYIAQFLAFCNQRLLRNRAKLPGIFIPARLHARFKPLNYTNQRAKQLLGWSPRYGLETSIQRSCGSNDLLSCSLSGVMPTVHARSQ